MDSIGAVGTSWLRSLVIVSSQASVVILLVLAAQWILRKRLTPSWRYALWLLVLVRLALPWTPESHVSVFNLQKVGAQSEVARPSTANAHHASVPNNPIQGSPASGVSSQRAVALHSGGNAPPPSQVRSPAHAPANVPARRLNPWRIFFICWAIGAVALTIRVAADVFRLGSRIRALRPVTDSRVLDAALDIVPHGRVPRCLSGVGRRVPTI